MPKSHLKKIIIILLVSLPVLAGTLFYTSELVAGRIVSTGKADAYEYSIRGDSNSSIYVSVNVNMHNPNALKSYLEANNKRIEQLLETNEENVSIPVQITLKKPVPVAEIKEIVDSSALVVESFMLVGHSSLSNQRGTYVQFSSFDAGYPEKDLIAPDTGDEIVFEGVMVIQGKLPAPNLPQWQTYENIYLIDTTQVELLDILARNHSAETAGKEINIALPTPFWLLNW